MSFDPESNSLRIYLWEIARTPLLTPEEEIQLARRIKRGDDKARDQMIRANLLFVVKIANDYAGYGLPLADLISEGNLGLMKAVERFDPEKGGKLSTYAAWWIKQSIKRALANQSKTIRLPVHMVDKIAKVRRISTLLTEVIWREPTDDELADETGISRAKLAMLRQASHRPASLNEQVNEGENTIYGEIIPDERAGNPWDALDHYDMLERIGELLDVLDDRERHIIEERFGLNGIEPRTLDEVGTRFGITRERIRQLQNEALGKMRRALQKIERWWHIPLPQTKKKTKRIKLASIELSGWEQEIRNPWKTRTVQPISINNDEEYRKYLAILLGDIYTKILIKQRAQTTVAKFWRALQQKHFERGWPSAAEILQGMIIYNFAAWAGEISHEKPMDVINFLDGLFAA